MADPLTGIPTGTEAGDDATALDYLGRRAPMALQAQPALPVGGPATGVGSGPTLATGTGPTGGRSQTAAGGPTGSSGMTAQIAQWLRGGATLAEIAAKIAGRSSAPSVASAGLVGTDVVSGASGGSATATPPDVILSQGRPFQIPPEVLSGASGGSALPSSSGAGPLTEGAGDVGGAAATEGQLGAGLATEAGSGVTLGQALPFLGAAVNIGMEAARGSKPAWQQGVNAGIDAAAAGAAGPTGGLSLLAAPVAKSGVEVAGKDTGLLGDNPAPWYQAATNFEPVAMGTIGLGRALANLFGADPFERASLFDVQVPGYSHPIKQTAGGAKTSQASYEEGVGGAQGFAGALGQARSADDLVRAINQPWSPHAGQFRIDATTSAGERISNLGPGWGSRTFHPADLSDPAVLASLTVQAGAMGAPADQPALADALRKRVQALHAPVPTAVPPPLPAPAPVNAPTAAVSPGGGGGLVELAQVLQA